MSKNENYSKNDDYSKNDYYSKSEFRYKNEEFSKVDLSKNDEFSKNENGDIKSEIILDENYSKIQIEFFENKEYEKILKDKDFIESDLILKKEKMTKSERNQNFSKNDKNNNLSKNKDSSITNHYSNKNLIKVDERLINVDERLINTDFDKKIIKKNEKNFSNPKLNNLYNREKNKKRNLILKMKNNLIYEKKYEQKKLQDFSPVNEKNSNLFFFNKNSNSLKKNKSEKAKKIINLPILKQQKRHLRKKSFHAKNKIKSKNIIKRTKSTKIDKNELIENKFFRSIAKTEFDQKTQNLENIEKKEKNLNPEILDSLKGIKFMLKFLKKETNNNLQNNLIKDIKNYKQKNNKEIIYIKKRKIAKNKFDQLFDNFSQDKIISNDKKIKRFSNFNEKFKKKHFLDKKEKSNIYSLVFILKCCFKRVNKGILKKSFKRIVFYRKIVLRKFKRRDKKVLKDLFENMEFKTFRKIKFVFKILKKILR